VSIKAVFFDWFNTLAYYFPLREELEQQALKELGFSVPLKIVSQGLYLSDKEFYEENARLSVRMRSPAEQTQLYLKMQRTILSTAGIEPTESLAIQLNSRMAELYTGMKFVLFGDVVPALKVLKERKLAIGLLTNLQTEVGSMCRQLGIAAYIDFAVTSAEVGADKPQPPIFLRALELAKVKPDEAIHVGDQFENDIRGARGVGIKAILIDRIDLHQDITDCPRLNSLSEVVNYLY
jgi:FMN phosphatase YigB (HAD superfamily)